MQSTLDRIAHLHSWAPEVLALGSRAPLADLRAIVGMRARLDDEVPAAWDCGDPAPFLALLDADRACVPFCGTLLYLTAEEAREAAGGHLNPLSWYGVHLWEVTAALSVWVDAVSGGALGRVHHAEVFAAVESIRGSRGLEPWFQDTAGVYRTRLAPEARTALIKRIGDHRAAVAAASAEVAHA